MKKRTMKDILVRSWKSLSIFNDFLAEESISSHKQKKKKQFRKKVDVLNFQILIVKMKMKQRWKEEKEKVGAERVNKSEEERK